MSASQCSPALNPTTDLLPQASLRHLFTVNYLAPVGICAYNPCPGVGKWLLKTVLSNPDITQPTLERLTCLYGSPHHYPFSLACQFPLKWWLGSNNQKYNHIITFQETLYWNQSYKFKKQSRRKKKKRSFHLVHEYFRYCGKSFEIRQTWVPILAYWLCDSYSNV